MLTSGRFKFFFAFSGLAILSTLLVFPPFLKETVVGHDLLYHLNWAEEFQRQFFEGDLYPRWLFEMKGGRGSPVFYYYGPLPYYISALFAAILPVTNKVLVSLGATYCLALLISSIGVYWFFCLSKERGMAFLFTMLYMLYPYHLVADLYIRFAFGEFFAIAWVPFLFVFTRKLAEGRKTALPLLAIFYALLIVSHIPTALLLTPVLLLYVIILNQGMATICRVLSGFILGAGLAAFYLLPMVDLISAVSLEKMTTGHAYYQNAFLMSSEALRVKHEGFRSLLHNLAIASLVATVAILLSNRKPTREALFFGAISITALFMMYPPSQFLWDLIPFLKRVQFPWRFFIVISFSLFYLAAAGNGLSAHSFYRYSRAVALIVFGGLDVITIYFGFLESTQHISNTNQAIITKSLEIKEGAVEYLPAHAPASDYEKVGNRTLERVSERFTGRQGPITFSATSTGGRILATIETPEAQEIVLHQYHFPTWQGRDTDNKHQLNLYRTQDSLIGFVLGKGQHKLSFTHRTSPAEKAGNIISMLSSGIVFLLFAVRFLKTDVGR